MKPEPRTLPLIGPNEYRCSVCDGVFEKGWTDEEASAEQSANGFDQYECDIVCDDCYNKVMEWANGRG